MSTIVRLWGAPRSILACPLCSGDSAPSTPAPCIPQALCCHVLLSLAPSQPPAVAPHWSKSVSGSKPPDLSVIEFSDIHKSVLLGDLGTTPAERKENAQKTNCFSALIENPPPCPLAGMMLPHFGEWILLLLLLGRRGNQGFDSCNLRGKFPSLCFLLPARRVCWDRDLGGCKESRRKMRGMQGTGRGRASLLGEVFESSTCGITLW